eukprot:TRINITY_DN2393_c0_g1_i1.p1 TRINITY_DN2393_c0_g1~~TRINITY_DN2393_c0_g1_i1.p1  ORF type:complete len:1118 (-),score=267.47 TRINITY_DN2393_c0_g1_i1:1140-4493(-)
MEALVLKMLKKTLRIFIKDFSEDSFSLQAMKGEGTIQNMDLNEQVIQEMLMIPTTLQVMRSKCDLLTVRVPWTAFKKEPALMTLNNVEIDLREPETVPPMPTILKQLRKKPKRNEIIDNMQISIKSVNMTIRPLDGPQVTVQLEDIFIQSTNSKWEPGNLSEIRMVNKDQKTEMVHKLLTVGAISVSLSSEHGTHSLLTRMPLEIHMTQKRRIKDWALLSASVELLFQHVVVSFTQRHWWDVQRLVRALQQCLARPVPPPPAVADTPTSSKKDKVKDKDKDKDDGEVTGPPSVSYHVHLERWMVEFIEPAIDPATGQKPGYSLFGEGLHVSFSAATGSITRPGDGAGTPLETVQIHETILSIVIAGFQFSEFAPAAWKNPLHNVLVSRREGGSSSAATIARSPSINILSLSGKEDEDSPSPVPRQTAHSYSGYALLKGTIILRRPIIPAAAVDLPPPQLPNLIRVEVNLSISQLQLVTDRLVWRKFIVFIAGKSPEEAELERMLEDKDKEHVSPTKDTDTPTTRKRAQERLQKLKSRFSMGEDWSSQIKINLKATDLRLIVPAESEGEYANTSVYFDLGALIMGNHSDWASIPHMPRALALIHAPAPVPPASSKALGFSHKFTFQLESISCNVHLTPPAGGDAVISPVLPPASIRLYVKYYQQTQPGTTQTTPHMELVLHSGELNMDATKKQLNAGTATLALNPIRLLQFIARKYLDPRKITQALGARVQKARAAAASKLGISGSPGDLVPKLQVVRPLKQKVAGALDKYKWTIYIHIDKGVFRLPLHHLLAPTGDDDLVETAPGQASTKKAAELKFGGMDWALENSHNGQTIVIHLSTFQATDMEHPKLPTSLNLIPLQIAAADTLPDELKEGDNLQFRYKRRRKFLRPHPPGSSGPHPPSTPPLGNGTSGAPSPATPSGSDASSADEWMTEVWGRLQGMQVKVMRRPGARAPTAGMGLPDMQAMVNKVVSAIQSRKGDIDALKQNVKDINFDVRWGIELGNVEVLMGDASSREGGTVLYKPVGTVRLSDSNRTELIRLHNTLEGQLLQARLSLATIEADRDVHTSRIAELEHNLGKLQDSYQSVEMKLVQAKMAMAEQQMENDNLRSALKRYEKK